MVDPIEIVDPHVPWRAHLSCYRVARTIGHTRRTALGRAWRCLRRSNRQSIPATSNDASLRAMWEQPGLTEAQEAFIAWWWSDEGEDDPTVIFQTVVRLLEHFGR